MWHQGCVFKIRGGKLKIYILFIINNSGYETDLYSTVPNAFVNKLCLRTSKNVPQTRSLWQN